MSDLVDHGSTNPATRLMPINTSPASSNQRRGRTMAQMSGHKAFNFSDDNPFFFSGFAASLAEGALLLALPFVVTSGGAGGVVVVELIGLN